MCVCFHIRPSHVEFPFEPNVEFLNSAPTCRLRVIVTIVFVAVVVTADGSVVEKAANAIAVRHFSLDQRTLSRRY